jgi:hypothetical protein
VLSLASIALSHRPCRGGARFRVTGTCLIPDAYGRWQPWIAQGEAPGNQVCEMRHPNTATHPGVVDMLGPGVVDMLGRHDLSFGNVWKRLGTSH